MIGAEVETGQAILAWLRARQEAFADLLLELASLELPSREPESQAPLRVRVITRLSAPPPSGAPTRRVTPAAAAPASMNR